MSILTCSAQNNFLLIYFVSYFFYFVVDLLCLIMENMKIDSDAKKVT